MTSISEMMDDGLAQILTTHPVTGLHPGNNLILSFLYPSAESAKNDAVPVLNTRGRFQVSSNSLNMPGTSTFSIPPGSILSQCWLSAAVDIARYVHAPSGWLLDCVDQIVYQFSGASTINNSTIDGGSYKQLVLASTDNQEKRQAIIEAGGDYLNGTAAALTNQQASIPIWLPWSSPDIHGAFPYDTSTLTSNLQIQIKWKNPYEVFYGENAQVPVMPTAFNYINFKAKQSDILGSGAFKVNNAMNMNPEMVYTVPYMYCQSFTVDQLVTSGTEGVIVLQSMPVGQLAAIIVEPILNSQVGISANSNVVTNGSLIQDMINLRFNGSDLIKYDYKKEQQLVDTISTNGNGYRYTTTSGASISSSVQTSYNNSLTVLPLMFDFESLTMHKWFENVPSYGGSVLEYRYRIDSYALAAAPMKFKFTYVINGLIENKFHTVRSIL